MVKVEIDEGSGFCFGVVTAINKAEEELANGGTLYCLGDIVHNSREVERLKEMGLITINHDDFNHLHDAKVLLRAHGEPPETYEIARRNNIEIIDATCPQVANRIPNIRKFAASHDLVFFVSGKKSSNGKMLFSECKKVNPNSHLIDSAEEIDSSLLTGASSIGVCGATSTPKWLMEEISKAIQSRLTGQ